MNIRYDLVDSIIVSNIFKEKTLVYIPFQSVKCQLYITIWFTSILTIDKISTQAYIVKEQEIR